MEKIMNDENDDKKIVEKFLKDSEFIGGTDFYPPDENDILVKNFLEAKTAFEKDLEERRISPATLNSDMMLGYRQFCEYFMTMRPSGKKKIVILPNSTQVLINEGTEVGFLYNSNNEVIGIVEL
jgi:hypothetical protein